MPRRRRRHKPLDIWRQRAISYEAYINQWINVWEHDNVTAWAAMRALRRLLDGRPLEADEVKHAVVLAEQPIAVGNRIRAIIERNILAKVLDVVAAAEGTGRWTGKAAPAQKAVIEMYRRLMQGRWKRAFTMPEGDDAPPGMEDELYGSGP